MTWLICRLSSMETKRWEQFSKTLRKWWSTRIMAKNDKSVKRGVYLYIDGKQIKNDVNTTPAYFSNGGKLQYIKTGYILKNKADNSNQFKGTSSTVVFVVPMDITDISKYKTIYRITENVPIERGTEGQLTTWQVFTVLWRIRWLSRPQPRPLPQWRWLAELWCLPHQHLSVLVKVFNRFAALITVQDFTVESKNRSGSA